jgi:mono/diheme cytochrome c family protein
MTKLPLALALFAVMASACDENILDPMADSQPRVNRYKQSKFFDNGLSMLAPPEGTVPRERITLNAPLTTGRDPDGPIQTNGEPLPRFVVTIPVPMTAKLLETGRKRYDITCATCHGPVGDGESLVARQMALRPPPSLHRYVDRPAGYIYEVITKGFGMMASYAAELTVEERWAVVAYVRALQLSQGVPASELSPEDRQKVEAAPPSGAHAPAPAQPAHPPVHHQETP